MTETRAGSASGGGATGSGRRAERTGGGAEGGAAPPGTAAETSGASLVVTRFLPFSRERVYAAWTDADSMRRWMCPGDVERAEADLDVREGGRYRIDMFQGEEVYEHRGEYVTVEPPARLVFTWTSRATGGRPSIVTVELEERDGGTELVLTHERLPDEEVADMHRGGWTSILEKLEARLGAGA